MSLIQSSARAGQLPTLKSVTHIYANGRGLCQPQVDQDGAGQDSMHY